MVSVLNQGRTHFDRHEWSAAHAQFALADHETALDTADVERMATAAYLIGLDTESATAWSRAYHEHLANRDWALAGRCAFWMGFGLMMRGEYAQAGGWLARARRQLDQSDVDRPEQGLILIPLALQQFEEGEVPAAFATFTEIGVIGKRWGSADLMAVSHLGCGHALIRFGRMADGVALLDEAMVYVTAGEVTPVLVGLIYCGMIEVCHEIYDLRRARQWTDALSRWCESQPDLVPYRGECLVHRAEIMQIHGAWPDAMAQVVEACERLSDPPGQPAIGYAFYQRAEMLRLQGDFSGADEAYRRASEWGRTVQPGLSLLRLAQGHGDAAESAMRREALEIQDHSRRCRLLPAYVEVMLGVGDAKAARTGANQLADIATEITYLPLRAASWQATGAVLLMEGRPDRALESLRRAETAWQKLTIPYEAARVRTLIGQCCRELGDEETAQLEFDAALRAFRQLGARPDAASVEALTRKALPTPAGGLTAREVEVIRLIAAGKTNRMIATDLFLSEKTVARHISNIFAKLGLASRSAATAYAFEHRLV
ncbi:MAG TPA: LuxR C-terminal-related transcriptional regulator [Thermomicrobiales bacterium]|nr:LuxR C-terminal-related transcriptional regulator [Thermomicrobiales bacterium]